MGQRTAHGAARTSGRKAVIEAMPADEMLAGIPEEALAAEQRHPGGPFIAGHPATKAAGVRGGKQSKHRARLSRQLAVDPKDPEWAQYLKQAESFRRAQVQRLAQQVGGGQCGPAPAALVASAALALAGSRWRYSQGNLTDGARLATEVRQNLLGAHELCAREAMARAKRQPAVSALGALLASGTEVPTPAAQPELPPPPPLTPRGRVKTGAPPTRAATPPNTDPLIQEPERTGLADGPSASPNSYEARSDTAGRFATDPTSPLITSSTDLPASELVPKSAPCCICRTPVPTTGNEVSLPVCATCAAKGAP